MKEEVTPEWIRSLIPYTVFNADRENYRVIADVMEKMLDEIKRAKNKNE